MARGPSMPSARSRVSNGMRSQTVQGTDGWQGYVFPRLLVPFLCNIVRRVPIRRPKTSLTIFCAAIGLLLAMSLQLVLLARANSATWDEPDHTYAGYMQWKHGDFGLNAEHPPLVKFVATAPLLNLHLIEPPLLIRPYRLQEAAGGREFVFRNDASTILFRVRMATLIFPLLLAVLVFVATRELFGVGAAFLALGLIAFDPTLLAHSALLTTDAAQACFMFWAVYAFYRYMRVPTLARLITVGLVVGLALASKHSAVLLFPMLFLLAMVEVVWPHGFGRPGESEPMPRDVPRLLFAFTVITLLAVLVLWSWYGFHYAPRGNGLALNPSMPDQLHHVPSALQASVLREVDRLHLLPQSYTYGFAHVLIQSKAFTSFLLGTIHPHPVWFYFPVAMLIKSSLTFLVLFALGLWAVVRGRCRVTGQLLYLVIPAAVYMFFAMIGGGNIGVRHVLPVYVFLSVAIAATTWALVEGRRQWMYVVVALLIFQAASVIHAFPAYVSYANEAFGGPAKVHEYLSDSSADWGQQLIDTRRYLEARGIKNCWFAYFGEGVAEYSYYGIPCKPLITADSLYFDSPHDVPPALDGPVLMSASVLSGFEFGPGALNPYEQFKKLKPVAVIDYGVFVFNGHFDLPLAAALSHVQKAGVHLRDQDLSGALAEAQRGEELAPQSATVNAMSGQVLDAMGQTEKARVYYEEALGFATTVEPSFQSGTIASLRQRLNASKSR